MSSRTLGIGITSGALLSLFFFPYPLTLILSFVASLWFPPVAVLIGILGELIYFSHPHIVPYVLLGGGVLSLVAFFVRRFIKARIIS